MLKRKLTTALAAALLASTAGAALASDWAFDDPYWKRSETVRNSQTPQDSQAAQSTATKSKYDAVDNYNP